MSDTVKVPDWKLVDAWRPHYQTSPEKLCKAIGDLQSEMLDCGAIPVRPNVSTHNLMHVLIALHDFMALPPSDSGRVTEADVRVARAWLRDIGDNGAGYHTLLKLCDRAALIPETSHGR